MYIVYYTSPPLREQGLSKQNSVSREHHIQYNIIKVYTAYVVFSPPILGGLQYLSPFF
jgi:hypothetical protein